MEYIKIAQYYKPVEIKVLLVGEAPPSNGKTYFYVVPEKEKLKIHDSSMAATIFNHYFDTIPKERGEYKRFLNCLKDRGVFLIDIIMSH